MSSDRSPEAAQGMSLCEIWKWSRSSVANSSYCHGGLDLKAHLREQRPLDWKKRSAVKVRCFTMLYQMQLYICPGSKSYAGDRM